MKLLLDTHTFIWYVTNNSKLSEIARQLINEGDNEIFLNIASVWEMAIKYNIGKLSFKSPFEEFIAEQLKVNNFDLLDLKIEHLNRVANLELHHRDPFDRLIIVQAMVERMPIVSKDAAFNLYAVEKLW